MSCAGGGAPLNLVPVRRHEIVACRSRGQCVQLHRRWRHRLRSHNVASNACRATLPSFCSSNRTARTDRGANPRAGGIERIPTAGLARSVGAAARHRLNAASPRHPAVLAFLLEHHICGFVADSDCMEVAFGAACGMLSDLPPNRAFEGTRRGRPSTWRWSVAARPST